MNREIFRLLRAICSELEVPFKVWPRLLPVVQSVLNSTSLERLGNRLSLTAVVEIAAGTPLLSITLSGETNSTSVKLSELETLQRENLDETLQALDGIHKEAAKKADAARQKKIDE